MLKSISYYCQESCLTCNYSGFPFWCFLLCLAYRSYLSVLAQIVLVYLEENKGNGIWNFGVLKSACGGECVWIMPSGFDIDACFSVFLSLRFCIMLVCKIVYSDYYFWNFRNSEHCLCSWQQWLAVLDTSFQGGVMFLMFARFIYFILFWMSCMCHQQTCCFIYWSLSVFWMYQWTSCFSNSILGLHMGTG